jgi:hypothetical protein
MIVWGEVPFVALTMYSAFTLGLGAAVAVITVLLPLIATGYCIRVMVRSGETAP